MAKCLGKCYITGAGNYYESWLDMFYEISDEIRILDKVEQSFSLPMCLKSLKNSVTKLP